MCLVTDRCARVHAAGSVWLGNVGKEVSHSSGVAETEGVFPGSSLPCRAFTCCNRHQTSAEAVFADFTSCSPVIRFLPPGEARTCSTGERQQPRRLTRRQDHVRAFVCSGGSSSGGMNAPVLSHMHVFNAVEGMTAHIAALSLLVHFVCLTCQWRGVSSHRAPTD